MDVAVAQLVPEFDRVVAYHLQLEVVAVEEDRMVLLRRLAVGLGLDRLDGKAAAIGAQYLEHVKEDAQIPLSESEAEKQEQASVGQAGIQIVGQRRIV